MTCSDCTKARSYSQHAQFNPACLFCGVRMIQHLGTMTMSNADRTRRRRAMLEVWVNQGHSEEVIRSMVPGPLCLGPVKTEAFDAPIRSKLHSAGLK